MTISDVLKNLVVDSWYKAFVYLGALVFVISLFWDVKGITNAQALMLSAGLFLIGIGEWMNRTDELSVKPPNVYTGPTAFITTTVRKPCLVGIVLDLLGLALLALAIWNILKT